MLADFLFDLHTVRRRRQQNCRHRLPLAMARRAARSRFLESKGTATLQYYILSW